MEYRKLGSSDLKVSVIGYGAWGIGGAPFWNNEGDERCDFIQNNQFRCLILQSGIDDTLWEPGETITLKEDDDNLHSGNGGSAGILIQLLQENSQNTWDTMEDENISVV